MKSLVIDADRHNSDAPGDVHVEQRDIETRAGECRIAVMVAGICGTDLQILRGYAGFSGVPGHEFVGVVETAPDGDRHWIGQRVVGEINVGCGDCDWCKGDTANHCPSRTVLGIVGRSGAFASHLSLPTANLHTVPDALDAESAVLIEPTAAACEILTQVDIGPRARVGVVGDGRMALLVAQVLRTTGAAVTLFGKHDRKLRVARDLGLDAKRSTDDLPASTFDVTVDVTGRPAGLTRAMELVRPRGTVVMKSTFHGETPITLWPAIVDEVTLVGSRCGPFANAIDLLAGGQIHTRPLHAGTYPLEEFTAAFDAARSELKVLLRP
jgi:alcohol dehydrogenase